MWPCLCFIRTWGRVHEIQALWAIASVMYSAFRHSIPNANRPRVHPEQLDAARRNTLDHNLGTAVAADHIRTA